MRYASGLFAFGVRIISNTAMTPLTHIRHLDVTDPVSGDHSFIASASGMVRLEDRIYVIADDAHYLAIFSLNSAIPGQLIRLLPGDLPRDAAERKAVKPDFEILLPLPAGPDCSGFRLLAMGSGSTALRMRGAIIAISPQGMDAFVTILDLQPLYTALAQLCPNINLEGAIVRADQLILFNRGNVKNPATTIFSITLSALLAGGALDARVEAEIQLPYIGAVPLTVTDACRLDDGNMLLSTVAEATGDSYADGAIMAAAFVLLDSQFQVLRTDRIAPSCKIEGIAAQQSAEGLTILCVSDADDPDKPASFYRATLHM
jgi:hypothetical protein